MPIQNKKGQSTVEYVLLMTAVVGVIIALVAAKNGGFQSTMNTTLNTTVGDVSTAADSLAASHAPGVSSMPPVVPVPVNDTVAV